MSRPTDTGMNRTGIDTAPRQARELLGAGSEQATPHATPGEQLELARIRMAYLREAHSIGSVPPPASMKGVATAAKEMLKGHKPTVLIDKLSERIGFERTGVRLYDAVLTKFEVAGTWDGGPTREELAQIRDEELRHFHLVHEAMERLGGDPTAMTPSADLAGVASGGVLKVITDPRTTLSESLQALLIAERADIDGWSLLIELADSAGQSEMADDFREAHRREEEHARKVQTWAAAAVRGDMGREIGSSRQ